MCKRSIADSVAKSCSCSNPDYSWAVAGLDDEIDSLYDGEPTLGRMLEATVRYNFDEIKSQICSLTNDNPPVFGMQNICVCKLPDKQYCYLPAKIAEFQAADAALVRVPLWELCSADGTTNEVEGAILPYWKHEPGEFMVHSAMQLATQMITHDDALPFWAALMDSARSGEGDAKRSTRSRVRTPKRLDAAKKQEVLDYLHQAAANICVHLKPFSKGEVNTRAGFCCAFPLEQDGSDKQTDRPEFYHGWQDGKPALKDYFVHLYMNIDALVDFDMWTSDWMLRTAADLREAMLTFATELCHQFAHAMADISQNGGESPRFNDEAVIEPGFSFEQSIFGGRLNPGGNGGFWVAPWPDYSTEQFCANGAGKQDLCAFGRATLPPPETRVLDDQVWQQLFEQRFWDGTNSADGASKKLWLRDAEANWQYSRCNRREVVSRGLCFRAAEKKYRHNGAVQVGRYDALADGPDGRDYIVDENQDASPESQSDLLGQTPSCSWWLHRWMSMPESADDPWSYSWPSSENSWSSLESI